jgi:hypothetical protein
VSAEQDSAKLVKKAGVPPRDDLTAMATAYLLRLRRARVGGLLFGIAVGFAPWGEDTSFHLGLGRLFVGFLLGLLLSELLVREGPRQPRRAASLHRRSTRDLLPFGVRALPWLTLAPLLATPLLALGNHPRGMSSTSGPNGDSCQGSAYWPSTGALIATGAIALIALVATELVLRRLVDRAQPADDPDAWSLDHELRASSARSAVAAASAMGLAITATVLTALNNGAHSFVCPTPLNQLTHSFNAYGNVYSWAPAASPWLGKVTLPLLASAVAVWVACQFLPTPKVQAVLS